MEAIALRHQVMVLQQSGKRPEFSPFDQFLWMILSHLWSDWESCLEIIQQETAKRWNRLGRVLVSGKYRKNLGAEIGGHHTGNRGTPYQIGGHHTYFPYDHQIGGHHTYFPYVQIGGHHTYFPYVQIEIGGHHTYFPYVQIGGHHTYFPYGYKLNRYGVPRF